jgi:hypothetical protein
MNATDMYSIMPIFLELNLPSSEQSGFGLTIQTNFGT